MKHINVAPEAWRFLWPMIALVVLLFGLDHFLSALVLAIVVGISAWLFRDPRHPMTVGPQEVVTPVNGTCLSVGGAYDPWLERQVTAVEIRTSVYAGYRVFAPIEARMVTARALKLGPGRRGAEIHFRTDQGDDIVLRVRQRLPARLKLEFRPGERVGQGRAIGIAPFGGEFTLLLPPNCAELVVAGALLHAPVDRIGKLKYDAQPTNENVADETEVDAAPA